MISCGMWYFGRVFSCVLFAWFVVLFIILVARRVRAYMESDLYVCRMCSVMFAWSGNIAINTMLIDVSRLSERFTLPHLPTLRQAQSPWIVPEAPFVLMFH